MWYFYIFFFSSRRRHTRCALVTGVQTCALPIFLALGFFLLFARNTEDAIGNADVDVLLRKTRKFGSQAVRLFIIHHVQRGDGGETTLAKIEDTPRGTTEKIGRASCRERGCQYV